MRRIITALLLTAWVGAQPSTGYDIMRQALNKKSWETMQSDLTLTMENDRGEVRVRKIAFYSADDENGLNRMLMRFQSPADVKGTGFLTLETASGDDERYLYLPALRRVKKIAASGSGGNFMSSDFTYYDIGKPKLEDWTYTLLGEETIDGKTCYKIESLPADDQIRKDTGYGKIIRWIEKERLNTVRSDYYDVSGSLWKRLEIRETLTINGIDFASDLVMHDLQINHTSRMVFSAVKVDQPLPGAFFTVRYLQRGR
ncbi:MAG: outer membrane lipoprotein-sorting protein [Candidatus Neomarinimicrobiota bacterium]|nr:MAG: outer membrane lipoprotein-sorting protein [Candidatus Neomarinimicrobiota bacterium]